MTRKFLICVAPSEIHTLHIVNRLCSEGVSNARIRTFLGFSRSDERTRSANGYEEATRSETGDATQGLSELGFPEWESQRCQDRVRAGKIVMCVQADDPDEMESVMQIFQEANGEEISSVSEVVRPSP